MGTRTNADEWLLSEGRSTARLSDLLTGLCLRLREEGLPVERSTLGAPLLHPIAQSAFASWSADEGGSDHWLMWTAENMQTMRDSPIYSMYSEGKGHRLKLEQDGDRDRFAIGRELAEQGYTEYAAIPLAFSDGSHKAFTACTKTPGGFPDEHYDRLVALCPALSAVLETHVLRNTARTLLDTYVGRRSGSQVLDGRIARGDGSHITAVIWYCDLRDFTGLSTRLDSQALLDRLNVYFGAVSEVLSAHDGEVLKFIGDAILAIFPVEPDAAGAVARAEAALGELIQARQSDDWPAELDFGVALHVGDVFYGNVGGADRLDFTVIGAAVNQVARIEGLCSQLNRQVLVSKEIASLSKRTYRLAGTFELKGIDQPVEVLASSSDSWAILS